jgi:hypothetical protein
MQNDAGQMILVPETDTSLRPRLLTDQPFRRASLFDN